MSGGNVYRGWIRSVEDDKLTNQEWWNNIRIANRRSLGYDGPLVYDTNGDLVHVNIQDIKKPTNNNPPTYRGMVFADEDKGLTSQEWWNRARIDNLRLFGYNGPIEYDEDGTVVSSVSIRYTH